MSLKLLYYLIYDAEFKSILVKLNDCNIIFCNYGIFRNIMLSKNRRSYQKINYIEKIVFEMKIDANKNKTNNF